MTNTIDFLLQLKEYVIPLIVGIATWHKDTIKTKLGFKAEEKNIESQTLLNLEKTIETLQKNLDIYQEMIEDLDTKYKNEIVGLRVELEEVRLLLKKYREKHGEID